MARSRAVSGGRHDRVLGVDMLWSMRTMSATRASTLIRDPEGNHVAGPAQTLA